MALACCTRIRFSIVGIFLFLVLMLCNCASTGNLTLNQNPGCETSVEGFYHCLDAWNKSKPAIIIRFGREMKVIAGEIVARDDKGVTFDPSGKGYIGDPKPEYFKFDKIEALIDENGEVVYGSIPAEYSNAFALELHLMPQDNPEAAPIVLQLNPNERFGFCFSPGDYIISEMRFMNNFKKIVDAGVDIPTMIISVTEKRSNYIGDI